MCLKCRCRGIRSGIAARRKEAEDYEYDGGQSLQRGASNQLLLQASDVLNEGKQLILWLDRFADILLERRFATFTFFFEDFSIAYCFIAKFKPLYRFSFSTHRMN